MSNKGVPGLRILCIFQFARNDENVNLGVYPESDPENIAYPSLFPVKCPFRILDITRVQKSTIKSSCGGWGVGCTRGLSSPRTKWSATAKPKTGENPQLPWRSHGVCPQVEWGP